jgi:hypothetical protein
MSGDDGTQRVAALKFRAARVAGLDFSRMTRDRAPGELVGMGGVGEITQYPFTGRMPVSFSTISARFRVFWGQWNA